MAYEPVLVGNLYGKWTVLSDSGRKSGGQPIWHCRCECGKEGDVQSNSLKNGHSTRCKSCGNLDRKLKHGMSGTTEWRSWVAMRNRCYYKGDIGYKNYGGRGITVCERWLGKQGFQNFLADMGLKPGSGYSLDRIDNEKGYSPENCQWASAVQQLHNRRGNRVLTINGEQMVAAEASRRFNVPFSTIVRRLDHGASGEEAVLLRNRT